MAKTRELNVNESPITVINQNQTDYISLTDMTASFREGSGLIGKWFTNKNTLEYIGVWEKINNPNFNYPEFWVITQEAGVNSVDSANGQGENGSSSTANFVSGMMKTVPPLNDLFNMAGLNLPSYLKGEDEKIQQNPKPTED